MTCGARGRCSRARPRTSNAASAPPPTGQFPAFQDPGPVSCRILSRHGAKPATRPKFRFALVDVTKVTRGSDHANTSNHAREALAARPAPEESKAFYREVFGWESEDFGPGMTLFRRPGYVGGEPSQPVARDVVAAMAPLPDEATPAYWSVDFWVHDADEVAEQAPGLGGRVLAPPFDDGGRRHAVVADPDGAPFSVTTAPRPRR